MRDWFQLPGDIAYYNAAHMGLMPKRALAAGMNGLQARARPWSPSGADALADTVRSVFGRIINASADDIAIVPSTSYGIAVAARIFQHREGAVLVLEDEHPSQVLGWMGRRAVRTVRRPTDGDWTRAIIDALNDPVGVVCVPQCHWLDGALIDLETVSDAVRSAGAALVVDATQSCGARQVDVSRIKPDLLAVSGYKWLLGPMGGGYCYVAPEHQNSRSIEDAFGARQLGSWFDADGHVLYEPPMLPGARRFDAGGSANPIQLQVALAGLETIEQIGVRKIETLLAKQNRELRDRHPDLKFTAGGEVSHILALEIDRPAAVANLLTTLKIAASIRGRVLRVSGHVWNDLADAGRIDMLLEEIKPLSGA